MKILQQHSKCNVTAVVFDFDGTVSTLRAGWEQVMIPLMEEYLPGQREKITKYVDASTGIQTVLQMKWLCEQIAESGRTPKSVWDYKNEYNVRLMESVEKKRAIAKEQPQQFLMQGAEQFLSALKQRGLKLYAASGTDEADVISEAACLGVDKYFDDIKGAQPFSEKCSKEATVNALIKDIKGENLLVIGDGPVEIRLGREAGGLTLGIAGNEKERAGFDAAKVKRLTAAGAHALVDCFNDADAIFSWMEE